MPASASSIAPVQTLPTRRPAAWRSAIACGDHAAARLGVGADAGAVVPAAAGDEHEVGVAEHAVGHDRRAVRRVHALLRLDRDEAGRQARLGQHLERPERVQVVEPVEQQDLDGHGEDRPAGCAMRRVAGMPMFVTIQPMHRIVVLALDAVVPLDLAIPAQVFGNYRQTPYTFVGLRGGGRPGAHERRVRRRRAGRSRGARDRPTRCSCPGFDAAPPGARTSPVLDALRGAHQRGARMVSICTGAFALAAAGVLDGHRATTHWRDAAALAARHPRVDVEPGVLYIDEGQVLTSAGVAAGLDLCLHILRRDHGAALANTIARRIVVPPHREGGQAQYVEQPVPDERRRVAGRDPRVGARAPARAAHGPHARHARARLRAHVRPPLPRRDRRPGPALAARPARRRRAQRAGVHRRLDRRDRPPLRLRHRREPAQALPPRDPHHPDRVPPRVHGPEDARRSSGRMNHSTATASPINAGKNQTAQPS